jgi:protein involved in polysaccharide export with SLBB domain
MKSADKNVFLLLIFALAAATLGLAQIPDERKEYIIGHGDLLAVTFWQRPELNTEGRVTAAGDVELPLIGAVRAAGLTPNQLRDAILSRISLLDIRITQAAVIVREYASKIVYMTGSVLTPGKQKFEVIPNLWQIILEAGGPQPTALLNDVTIVRGDGQEAGKIIHVDLTKALEQGNLTSLPPIYPGDTVHVPGIATGERGTPVSNVPLSPLERRDVVYVFGQVLTPGVINLDKNNMDLLDALVRAGGPTETANLKEVRLFFRGRQQAEMALINLDRYMRRSTPLPLLLHPGDAIYVPRRRGFAPFLTETLRFAIPSALAVLVTRF